MREFSIPTPDGHESGSPKASGPSPGASERSPESHKPRPKPISMISSPWLGNPLFGSKHPAKDRYQHEHFRVFFREALESGGTGHGLPSHCLAPARIAPAA